ncbi:cupin-like domain-containing protein [Marinimicrobium locisalis]|uniref:cupin-like domain-containing protein n=1 Tax=Marinimicrobium locisalis TaxID=546022 RepID=UPI003221ECFD
MENVSVIECHTPGEVPEELELGKAPVVLKGLVNDWPIVKAAGQSNASGVAYLKHFYNGRPTIVCKLHPDRKGRLFYNDDYTRLDYESYRGRVDDTLDAIYEQIGASHPFGYYIASNVIKTHFPGMDVENSLALPRAESEEVSDETVSIWIGNATTASCHYDALENIACCVAGRRRFTLFPPDQVNNLYPGPLEPTPGGQVISLVDFKDPDFNRFPGFREALNNAQYAELDPGDALYLPSMWWHHVEGLEPFNLLINYWWTDAAKYMTSGMNALYMAMLGIRDKPKHERDAWKCLFDYYIFEGHEKASAQLPEKARGLLEKVDATSARKLRALLINSLNR